LSVDLEAPLMSAARSAPANSARRITLSVTLLFFVFRFSFIYGVRIAGVHFDTHILAITCITWFVSEEIFAAYEKKLAPVWMASLCAQEKL
jgi:hypothetical protein